MNKCGFNIHFFVGNERPNLFNHHDYALAFTGLCVLTQQDFGRREIQYVVNAKRQDCFFFLLLGGGNLFYCWITMTTVFSQ